MCAAAAAADAESALAAADMCACWAAGFLAAAEMLAAHRAGVAR